MKGKKELNKEDVLNNFRSLEESQDKLQEVRGANGLVEKVIKLLEQELVPDTDLATFNKLDESLNKVVENKLDQERLLAEINSNQSQLEQVQQNQQGLEQKLQQSRELDRNKIAKFEKQKSEDQEQSQKLSQEIDSLSSQLSYLNTQLDEKQRSYEEKLNKIQGLSQATQNFESLVEEQKNQLVEQFILEKQGEVIPKIQEDYQRTIALKKLLEGALQKTNQDIVKDGAEINTEQDIEPEDLEDLRGQIDTALKSLNSKIEMVEEFAKKNSLNQILDAPDDKAMKNIRNEAETQAEPWIMDMSLPSFNDTVSQLEVLEGLTPDKVRNSKEFKSWLQEQSLQPELGTGVTQLIVSGVSQKSIQNQLESEEKEIQELERGRSELKQNLKKQQEQLESVNAKLDGVNQEISSILQQSQEAQSSLNVNLSSNKQRIDKFQSGIERDTRALEERRNEVSDATKTITQLMKQVESKINNIEVQQTLLQKPEIRVQERGDRQNISSENQEQQNQATGRLMTSTEMRRDLATGQLIIAPNDSDFQRGAGLDLHDGQLYEDQNRDSIVIANRLSSTFGVFVDDLGENKSFVSQRSSGLQREGFTEFDERSDRTSEGVLEHFLRESITSRSSSLSSVRDENTRNDRSFYDDEDDNLSQVTTDARIKDGINQESGSLVDAGRLQPRSSSRKIPASRRFSESINGESPPVEDQRDAYANINVPGDNNEVPAGAVERQSVEKQGPINRTSSSHEGSSVSVKPEVISPPETDQQKWAKMIRAAVVNYVQQEGSKKYLQSSGGDVENHDYSNDEEYKSIQAYVKRVADTAYGQIMAFDNSKKEGAAGRRLNTLIQIADKLEQTTNTDALTKVQDLILHPKKKLFSFINLQLNKDNKKAQAAVLKYIEQNQNHNSSNSSFKVETTARPKKPFIGRGGAFFK